MWKRNLSHLGQKLLAKMSVYSTWLAPCNFCCLVNIQDYADSLIVVGPKVSEILKDLTVKKQM